MQSVNVCTCHTYVRLTMSLDGLLRPSMWWRMIIGRTKVSTNVISVEFTFATEAEKNTDLENIEDAIWHKSTYKPGHQFRIYFPNNQMKAIEKMKDFLLLGYQLESFIMNTPANLGKFTVTLQYDDEDFYIQCCTTVKQAGDVRQKRLCRHGTPVSDSGNDLGGFGPLQTLHSNAIRD